MATKRYSARVPAFSTVQFGDCPNQNYTEDVLLRAGINQSKTPVSMLRVSRICLRLGMPSHAIEHHKCKQMHVSPGIVLYHPTKKITKPNDLLKLSMHTSCHISCMRLVRERVGCLVNQQCCPFKQPKHWRSQGIPTARRASFERTPCELENANETAARVLVVIFLTPDAWTLLQHKHDSRVRSIYIPACRFVVVINKRRNPTKALQEGSWSLVISNS